MAQLASDLMIGFQYLRKLAFEQPTQINPNKRIYYILYSSYFELHLGRERVEKLRGLKIARKIGQLFLFEVTVLVVLESLFVRTRAKSTPTHPISGR